MSRFSALIPSYIRWILIGVLMGLLAWRGVALSAGVAPSEVYVKLRADQEGGAIDCVALRAGMVAKAPELAGFDCRQMAGSPQTFRLRWTAVSHVLLEQWFAAQRRLGHVEWYEFAMGDMRLQAGDATSFYRDLTAASVASETPGFVGEAPRKLQNLLRIYRPASVVTIAVIDSGINFDGALPTSLQAVNTSEVPGNGIDDDANGYVDDVSGWDFVDEGVSSGVDDTLMPDNDPRDVLGHGTAVARIAAATVGADAANWLRFMPLRVASGTLGVGSVSPFALAEAIRYATSMNVKMINLSVGSSRSYQVVTDAINAALEKGVQVIAAAGNSSGAVLFPSNLPGVLAVGALDANGQIWSGSARGSEVALFLRGTDMLRELGGGLSGLSASGTSYAAPVATGMAAMLWAVVGDCSASAQTVRQFRPLDQRADSWAEALVNQYEGEVQGIGNLNERWERGLGVCGAQLTVAALLRARLP